MATSNKNQRSVQKKETQESASSQESANQPEIQWNDSNMLSTYSNVCNVASTREEIMLLFGMNQVWNNKQEDVVVELTNRIIMTPMAAKRLLVLLSRTLSDHEKNSSSTD
jgi:hypothetical protein